MNGFNSFKQGWSGKGASFSNFRVENNGFVSKYYKPKTKPLDFF